MCAYDFRLLAVFVEEIVVFFARQTRVCVRYSLCLRLCNSDDMCRIGVGLETGQVHEPTQP